MKTKSLILAVISTLLATTGIHAAGLTRDFSGPIDPNWGSDTQYAFKQENGLLKITTNKIRPWAGFTYTFDAPMDLSANPVVNLTLRAETGFLLSVYLRDASGNMILTYPVHRSESMHAYTYDFTGMTGINLAQVTGLIFAFNGAALSLQETAWLDEMRIGDDAVKAANFAALPDFSTYKNRTGLKIRLHNLENAASFSLSGGESLIENVTFTPISGGTATMQFDTVPDATGSANVTLTATGSGGAASTAQGFVINVEDNLPPTISDPGSLVALNGQENTIQVSGISDGNPTATQPLEITAVSDNPALTGAITVTRAGDSPYASLHFTPSSTGSTSLTITLTDNGGGDESTSLSVPLDVYASLNGAPSMNAPGKQVIVANKGQRPLTLTGISDGDDGSQTLSISAVSGDESIIANPIAVEYTGGDSAILTLTPNAANTGTTFLTVTITDDGAAEGNDGNQSSVFTIEVETVEEPLTGYSVAEDVMEFQGDPVESGTWRVEGQVDGVFTQILPSLVQKDGAPAFRFQAVSKPTWSGVWVNLPDLDLTENPSISYEIYVEVTTQSKIQTHVYFWDDNLEATANGARNTSGAHNARMDVFPNTWTQFAVNYNDVVDGLIDNNGDPINLARIQRILINFHPAFTFPFTSESFTVYIRQIKIGDQADVSSGTPQSTIAPVPDQLHASSLSPVARSIQLSNITNGDGLPGSIQVSTTNAAIVQDLAVGSVSIDGSATLTYKTSSAGFATVNLSVTAGGSDPVSRSFTVDVVDTAAPATTLTINRNQTFQTIHGFGTFEPPAAYLDLYTDNLGASAMRIGQISNQAENLNDNSDPLVLNRDALNYSVWDFDKLRGFKEAGVETFILTTWSPPAWSKENLSLNFAQAGVPGYDNTLNRLDEDLWDEYAENLIAVYRMLQEEAGIELAAIGPQNEPAFNEPYPSAILSPAKFAELIAALGPRFAAEGIDVRIMMPEQVFSQSFYSMAQYVDAVQGNPAANQYTDIIATHGYAANGVDQGQPNFSSWSTLWNNAQEGAHPKELWMSETFPENAGFDSAMNYAMYLYGALKYGNVSLWTSWSIENQFIRLGTPLEQFHAFKNYSKYIRPGAERIGISDGGDIYATAYEHADSGTMTVVVVNLGTTPAVVALDSANGADLPPAFTRYLTQEFRGFQNMGSVSGTVMLPARSVTTLVGSTVTDLPPAITSPLIASGTELQSFSYTITATNTPTSFGAAGLPDGLTFDDTTGTISGVPAVGTAGQLNIQISATNPAGTTTETLVLNIAARVNVDPVAAFTAEPLSGIVPLQVQFDASNSSDPDGSIASYAWDFGDGGMESGVTVGHTFVAVDNYTVTLTVTDNDGATDTETTTIFVTARPVVTFDDPVLNYPTAGSGGLVQHPFGITPSDATWTASEDAAWIILLTTSGSGPGTLNFRVQPNGGPARSAEIAIWDSVLTIRQAGVSPWAAFPMVDGWRDTDIGPINDDTLPYLWHQEHGICYYLASAVAENYYLYSYDGTLGWLYVIPDAYPFVYSVTYDSWLYYLPHSADGATRWFYHLGDPAYSDDGWFSFPE